MTTLAIISGMFNGYILARFVDGSLIIRIPWTRFSLRYAPDVVYISRVDFNTGCMLFTMRCELFGWENPFLWRERIQG